ncbi:MAG TPA: hypothetical protein VGR50_02440 [Terriglobales bacterium]|nr:hypothetical protein [Terriglobales bacterium]
MKVLFWAGLVVLILGIASFFIPVPHQETSGIKAGNINIGIQTEHDERVPYWVSAVVIVGGISMMLAGNRGK